MWIATCFEGFLLGIELIMAIGPQNAYVLQQGIIGRHVFLVALLCTLCDFFLIGAGVLGLGALVTEVTWLRLILVIGGVAFLLIYGGLSLWRAIKGNSRIKVDDSMVEGTTARMVVLSVLAFSFLNPQAFLDTALVIGGIASHFEHWSHRVWFTLGACLASAVWFFGLAYLARLFRPLFRKKVTGIIFDALTGLIMFYFAFLLIYTELVRPAAFV